MLWLCLGMDSKGGGLSKTRHKPEGVGVSHEPEKCAWRQGQTEAAKSHRVGTSGT